MGSVISIPSKKVSASSIFSNLKISLIATSKSSFLSTINTPILEP